MTPTPESGPRSSRRADLGRPLPDEIHRQRLIDRLAQRWSVAVITVEAPTGYGKSTALAQSIQANDATPSGYDVYVPCRPTYRDPNVLSAAVLAELGTELPAGELTTDQLVEAWTAALSGFSPDAVCLHLDDVHLLAEAAGAVGLLAAVVRQLPRNAHLVIAGRALPRLPIARLLAADQAIAIRTDDLAFTPDEISQLADHHDAEVDALAPLHGWPAMTRLALVVGGDATEEFLIDEVIEQLPTPAREALATIALGGTVDDDLLALAGLEVDLPALANRVPLVRTLDGGRYRVHDLWADRVDRLVDEARVDELLAVIVPWHSAARRHDEAVSIAAAAERWPLAGRAVIAALGDGDVGTTAEETARWLALFPDSQADEPELLFLRGMTARLEHGAGHGVDEVALALDLFEERGDVEAAAIAAFERGFQGWLANDTDAILDVLGRAPKLIEAGATQLLGLNRLADAAMHEMAGDFQAAFEASSSVDFSRMPRAIAELIARHTSTMAFLIGESGRAAREAERVAALDPSARNRFVLAIARYENDDPTDVLEAWPTNRYPTVGNRRDDFWLTVFSCAVDASVGLAPRAEQVREQAWDRSREQAFAAIMSAAAEVIAGDEAAAAAHIEELVDRMTLDDRLVEGELRRFLPYGYVLSPRVRAHFDDPAIAPALGPHHRRRLAMARIPVALRAGRPVDWSGYESPEAALCGLPLPWSVDLACGLMIEDRAAGAALADYLLTVGTGTEQLLRQRASSDNPTIAEGATAILTSLAAPPETPTQLRVIGQSTIDLGEGPTTSSRGRVRQLLGLLVLRRSITRQDAAELLWPDLDPVAGRNNLRINLAHLRRELEPGRQAQEPTFHIRDHGDRLVLHRSDSLTVDLWSLLDEVDNATTLSAATTNRAAMLSLESAIQRWTGQALIDLRSVVGLRSELAALDDQLFEAGIELAQWLLSDGRLDEAGALAERLVGEEPTSERARGVQIAVHLENGALDAAAEAIDECIAVLDGLGRRPGPTILMLAHRHEVSSAA